MANEKQISIAQLNIVALEHNENTYIELLNAAFQLRRPIKYRGSDFLMLGELLSVNSDKKEIDLKGRFYKFTHIDHNADWFDFDQHDTAPAEEVAKKVRIPENLKPNCVRFDFVFRSSNHTLYYISKDGKKTMGPSGVSRFLNTLFQLPELFKKFGEIKVTVIPEHETLDKIFSIYRLSHLTILLHCPNPDETGSEEERVKKRLIKQKAKSLKQEFSALPNETIEPDEETKLYARVASENGRVIGKGSSVDNLPIKLSTADHPKIMTVRFDPESETEREVLIRESTP